MWKYYQKLRNMHAYDIVISLLGKWPLGKMPKYFFKKEKEKLLFFAALLKIRKNLKISKI